MGGGKSFEQTRFTKLVLEAGENGQGGGGREVRGGQLPEKRDEEKDAVEEKTGFCLGGRFARQQADWPALGRQRDGAGRSEGHLQAQVGRAGTGAAGSADRWWKSRNRRPGGWAACAV